MVREFSPKQTNNPARRPSLLSDCPLPLGSPVQITCLVIAQYFSVRQLSPVGCEQGERKNALLAYNAPEFSRMTQTQ